MTRQGRRGRQPLLMWHNFDSVYTGGVSRGRQRQAGRGEGTDLPL